MDGVNTRGWDYVPLTFYWFSGSFQILSLVPTTRVCPFIQIKLNSYFLWECKNRVTHRGATLKKTGRGGVSHSAVWLRVCECVWQWLRGGGTLTMMMRDEVWRGRASWVYDRFLLLSKFLKLAGLIFISANWIECSWPFQWNQLIPCGSSNTIHQFSLTCTSASEQGASSAGKIRFTY